MLTATSSSRVSPRKLGSVDRRQIAVVARHRQGSGHARRGREGPATGKGQRRRDPSIGRRERKQGCRGQTAEFAAARPSALFPFELFDREFAAFERAERAREMHAGRSGLEHRRLGERKPIRATAVEGDDVSRPAAGRRVARPASGEARADVDGGARIFAVSGAARGDPHRGIVFADRTGDLDRGVAHDQRAGAGVADRESQLERAVGRCAGCGGADVGVGAQGGGAEAGAEAQRLSGGGNLA